jgi:hypothetical protein
MRSLSCPRVSARLYIIISSKSANTYIWTEYKDLEARVDALRNAHIAILKYISILIPLFLLLISSNDYNKPE